MMCILTKCKESCVYIRAGNINLHHINWLICQTFHHCQIFFRRMTAYIYNDLCIILFQKRNIPLTEKIDTRILQTNRIHHASVNFSHTRSRISGPRDIGYALGCHCSQLINIYIISKFCS